MFSSSLRQCRATRKLSDLLGRPVLTGVNNVISQVALWHCGVTPRLQARLFIDFARRYLADD